MIRPALKTTLYTQPVFSIEDHHANPLTSTAISHFLWLSDPQFTQAGLSSFSHNQSGFGRLMDIGVTQRTFIGPITLDHNGPIPRAVCVESELSGDFLPQILAGLRIWLQYAKHLWVSGSERRNLTSLFRSECPNFRTDNDAVLFAEIFPDFQILFG